MFEGDVSYWDKSVVASKPFNTPKFSTSDIIIITLGVVSVFGISYIIVRSKTQAMS